MKVRYLITIVALAIVLPFVFWAGVGYIAIHFISKFW